MKSWIGWILVEDEHLNVRNGKLFLVWVKGGIGENMPQKSKREEVEKSSHLWREGCILPSMRASAKQSAGVE